jgi:hypothetical protein
VGDPLAVEAGLKVPQGALPQVTDQVTPAFLLSLLTTAVRPAVALVASEVGGAGLKATEIAGGAGAVIVIVAETVLVVSLTEVAVTVTVLEVGTAAGAV